MKPSRYRTTRRGVHGHALVMAHSNVPALGYTVPYAIRNVLLTAWGPVLVAMMWIGK